ncbi:MAG: hypothetical protein B6I31_03165 [Desulfobacteraceae bacterium 4572_19]|nr:MAG: hypothetical protein B6I31_03165 [Desulfobacteraceae bacterium 4572_19]
MSKNVEFPMIVDAIINSLLHRYNIPTRLEFEKVIEKINRLEKLVADCTCKHDQEKPPFIAEVEVLKSKEEKKKKKEKKSKKELKVKKIKKVKKHDPYKLTPSQTEVLRSIENNKSGAVSKIICKETGFDDKKVRNALHQLKQLGRIKCIKRGVYTAE